VYVVAENETSLAASTRATHAEAPGAPVINQPAHGRDAQSQPGAAIAQADPVQIRARTVAPGLGDSAPTAGLGDPAASAALAQRARELP